MKCYLDNLRKLSEHALKTKSEARTVNYVSEPLESQINKWWSNIPEASRQRAFNISEIAAICKSYSTNKPALRNVAAALRNLGWQQKREWVKQGPNRRLWEKTVEFNPIPEKSFTKST
jgi:hypothetical protein